MPIGVGQRLAVFAQPGVGKSTLMNSLAEHSNADVQVIALIGERGREVQEAIENLSTSKRRSNTILVSSSSDQSAVMRANAAATAMRIAEFFRDSGYAVLFQLDSLTRLARAWREIGLASGQLPVRRGYPASVFERLPRFLECPGRTQKGSITALFTVLQSEQLDEDPIVEETKGILDGHLMLAKTIAESGRYPALDITSSISRLNQCLLTREQLNYARIITRLASRLRRDRDMMILGTSLDPELEAAAALEPHLEKFLSQDSSEGFDIACTESSLKELGSTAFKLLESTVSARGNRTVEE